MATGKQRHRLKGVSGGLRRTWAHGVGRVDARVSTWGNVCKKEELVSGGEESSPGRVGLGACRSSKRRPSPRPRSPCVQVDPALPEEGPGRGRHWTLATWERPRAHLSSPCPHSCPRSCTLIPGGCWQFFFFLPPEFGPRETQRPSRAAPRGIRPHCQEVGWRREEGHDSLLGPPSS